MMLQYELLTLSECVCGIGSVVLILLCIRHPFVLPEKTQYVIFAVLGVICVCAAVLSAVLLPFGIQLDFGYGENTAGLFAAGMAVFFLHRKLRLLLLSIPESGKTIYRIRTYIM